MTGPAGEKVVAAEQAQKLAGKAQCSASQFAPPTPQKIVVDPPAELVVLCSRVARRLELAAAQPRLLRRARRATNLPAEARLRTCANRSWPSGGSGLPTVTNPGFSDEPSYDDDHV